MQTGPKIRNFYRSAFFIKIGCCTLLCWVGMGTMGVSILNERSLGSKSSLQYMDWVNKKISNIERCPNL